MPGKDPGLAKGATDMAQYDLTKPGTPTSKDDRAGPPDTKDSNSGGRHTEASSTEGMSSNHSNPVASGGASGGPGGQPGAGAQPAPRARARGKGPMANVGAPFQLEVDAAINVSGLLWVSVSWVFSNCHGASGCSGVLSKHEKLNSM